MRNLLAVLFLIFSLNTWAQKPGEKPLSSPEPSVQVRQEFLRSYNAKDADAVVALYAEDATLVSDGGTFKGRDEVRKWVKSGLDQGSKRGKEFWKSRLRGRTNEKACRFRHSSGTILDCDGEAGWGVEDCSAFFAEC